ncbi:MAG: hypothetical protein R6U95_06495 [Bacteroidales bacterium]
MYKLINKNHMKLHVLYYVCVALFVLVSCTEEPDHSLRVQNDTQKDVYVKIGDVLNDTIKAGERTTYYSIEEGMYQMTGNYKADIKIGGDGVHKWTVIIKPDDVQLVQVL